MNKITQKVKQDEVKLTNAEKLFVRKVSSKRDSLAERYPFVFAGGAAFGLVSTFYGFEKLIDRVDLFSDQPWILLGTGIATLIVTGTLYNKL